MLVVVIKVVEMVVMGPVVEVGVVIGKADGASGCSNVVGGGGDGDGGGGGGGGGD